LTCCRPRAAAFHRENKRHGIRTVEEAEPCPEERGSHRHGQGQPVQEHQARSEPAARAAPAGLPLQEALQGRRRQPEAARGGHSVHEAEAGGRGHGRILARAQEGVSPEAQQRVLGEEVRGQHREGQEERQAAEAGRLAAVRGMGRLVDGAADKRRREGIWQSEEKIRTSGT
jgi:hypothetical protein